MKTIQEGSAVIKVPTESKISRKLEVFYNPAMKLNRDITVLLLNSVENKQMQIADIMAGTGVRSIRIAKELKKGKVKTLAINDAASMKHIKDNLKLNKVKAEVTAKDANEFLLQGKGFDYIDIDPFGTPNDFLDSAVKRISRNGILGITATDTAALCGTYPKTAVREYWAKTYRNGFMHESALRILCRKVQLVAAQYSKAMIPIFGYSKEHYVRIFFKCIKSKTKADEIMKQHKFILYNPKTLEYEVSDKNSKQDYVAIGPLYVGALCDKELVGKMLKLADDNTKKVLTLIYNELDIVGSYDIHDLSKLLKMPVPSYEALLKKVNGTRTHYNKEAMKTKLSIDEIKKLF